MMLFPLSLSSFSSCNNVMETMQKPPPGQQACLHFLLRFLERMLQARERVCLTTPRCIIPCKRNLQGFIEVAQELGWGQAPAMRVLSILPEVCKCLGAGLAFALRVLSGLPE